MAKGKVAVLYLRRSTEKQEHSIDDQRSTVMAYAEADGYHVLREYVDDGISGADTAKREAFQQMVEDARSGDFDTVLCYDVSRFSRDDPDEAGYWRHVLRQRGVEVEYVADTIPEGIEGDIILSVTQTMKHRFLHDLSRETLRGAVSTARKGFSAGKPAPYGYRRLAIDERTGTERVLQNGQQSSSGERVKLVASDNGEPAVVRDIFGMFVGGAGYKTIAQELNRRGVPSPRGGRWSQTTIRDLLLNPAYCGDAVYNRNSDSKFYTVREGVPTRRPKRERGRLRHNPKGDWIVVRDAHEAIVARETWQKAQRRIKDGKRNGGPLRDRPNSPHLLSGLVYCGACSHKMHGEHQRSVRNGEVYRYRRYRCSSAMTGRLEGHSNWVLAEKLEPFVVGQVEEFYKRGDVAAVAEDILRSKLAAERPARAMEVAQRRLADIDGALEKANRRILMLPNDDLVAGVVAEVEKLRAERIDIEREMADWQASLRPGRTDIREMVSRMRDFGRHLREMYEEAPLAERKAFFRWSLLAPEGEIGPLVLDFTPSTEGRRRHGILTGGALWVRPLAGQFHGFDGGGTGIRTRG